ncbi:MAG: RDD family protein [Smithellaceae bacterium]
MAVYKFAGFWRRFVAYTVDNIIINIIFLILTVIIATAFVFGSMSGNTRDWITDLTNPANITSLFLLVAMFYIIISTAYFTYFHGIKGRTPGKMLLGLQVLSVAGAPIGFGIAFLRAVGYLVSSLLFTIPVGFLWAAFDKRKQGWHDKIAGTVVIIRPHENEAVGLTIPPEGEKQSETSSPAMVQSSEPIADENKAVADKSESSDQKIS